MVVPTRGHLDSIRKLVREDLCLGRGSRRGRLVLVVAVGFVLFFSVALVFASRTLVVSILLERQVAMQSAIDVTILPLSSLLAGLLVSCS